MLKAWKEMEEKAIHYAEVKSLSLFCVLINSWGLP